ncbi:MAG TPA: DUF1801 domain-containing protein [Bacteroidia bacterium]|jgi:hypothetical protein|nr:DUF1801 domain-containing protein [Bacteroidia bacterium]
MLKLKHPLTDVIEYVRNFVLSIDKEIGQGIYWNAPAFFYTGKMKSFEPKEYKRYIIGFVLNRKDVLRMVFLTGAKVDDKSGILEGDYKDGRRLITFKSIDEFKTKEKQLKKLIKEWIKLID